MHLISLAFGLLPLAFPLALPPPSTYGSNVDDSQIRRVLDGMAWEEGGKDYPHATPERGAAAMQERVEFLEYSHAQVLKQTDRPDQTEAIIRLEREIAAAKERLRQYQALIGSKN